MQKIKKFLVIGLIMILISIVIVTKNSLSKDNKDNLEENIRQLIKQLGNSDWEKRNASADKLFNIGKPSLSLLEAAQKDSDPEIRNWVKDLITGIHIKLVIPPEIFTRLPVEFVKKLKRPDSIVCIELILQIAELSQKTCLTREQAREIASRCTQEIDWEQVPNRTKNEILDIFFKYQLNPVLELLTVEMLNDKDEDFRYSAIATLGQSGSEKTVPAIIMKLKDTSADVRERAIYVLKKYFYAKEAGPEIIKSLNDKDWTVRKSAVSAVGELVGNEAISEIIKKLNDDSWEVRKEALRVLGKLRRKEVIHEIIKRLDDDRIEVQVIAFEVLVELDCRKVIPDLIGKLEVDNGTIRFWAVYALGKLGDKENVIFSITERLKDNDYDVRRMAIISLAELGAKKAIPEIIKRLYDENDLVRRAAVVALGNLNAREAIHELKKLLNDRNVEIGQLSVLILRKLGAKELEFKVNKMLNDNDAKVRKHTIKLLCKIVDKEMIPEIIERLEDSNGKVRLEAVRALSELGGKEVIPEIVNRLNDDYWLVRATAIEALSKLGSKEAIPKIIKKLDDMNISVREAAVEALGKLQAKEAVPHMVKRLKDSHSWVRAAARKVLKEWNVKPFENNKK